MKDTRIIECPQIRYHISYDEKLTLKDLEDLINLIRISNNDALQEMGISRSKGNDLQKIEKVEAGSIEIIMAIIEALSDIASVVSFVEIAAAIITGKIRARRDRPVRNPREDRKVYEKHDVTIKREGHTNTALIIHIHIHNHEQ